jgi:hypothetical protein
MWLKKVMATSLGIEEFWRRSSFFYSFRRSSAFFGL